MTDRLEAWLPLLKPFDMGSPEQFCLWPPPRTASAFRLKDIPICNQWHLSRCVSRVSLSWVQQCPCFVRRL